MSNADDFLRSGDLDGARRVLIEDVRRKPGDVLTRLFLFQLLSVRGEWDKAATHLGVLAQLSPEAAMLAVVYGQAIAAEREREAVFAGTSTAMVHGGPSWADGVADSIRLMAIGDGKAALTARDEAFEKAPDLAGTIDGQRFEWIADADVRFGPCIEAIIGGRYGLLPFDAIAGLKSEGPKDLRDVVWYPVEIAMKAGHSVAALIPARYPGVTDDAAEQLGRATNWHDGPNGQTGSGQRLWSLSDGQDCELLSVRSLVLD
ncbi:MAG: type VI secretion system accessory protein TagJ [Pseudomonadota bacterium]|uniref:type VI secretion system accessory protein TagJ n=1 Tax=Sphingomonas sp. ERG5 TaxID=1381597 RepID=UPI00054B0A8B|nr:type VI secretion system accessory protein TagJ [Sphingomonas sp. ERG5]